MCYPDFLSVKLGLRIPIVSGIPDSLSCISDFTRIPGFRIPQAKFIEFLITQAKIPRIWDSCFPHMRRILPCKIYIVITLHSQKVHRRTEQIEQISGSYLLMEAAFK